MTLIVSFQDRYKNFAALGDLLLSWNYPTPASFKYPTQPSDRRLIPKSNLCNPTNLCQKLVLLRENLLLSWSGPHSYVCRMIDWLDIQLRNEVANPNELRTMLDYLKKDHPYPRDFSYTLHCLYKGQMHVSDLRCPQHKVSEVGKFRISGGGFSDFRKYAINSANMKRVGDSRTFSSGLLSSYASHLSFMQRSRGEGLVSNYGGGFEIAVVDGLVFRKLDRVLRITLIVQRTGESTLNVSMVDMTIQFYHQNHLCITSNIQTGSASGFAVPPPSQVRAVSGQQLGALQPQPPLHTSVALVLRRENGEEFGQGHLWTFYPDGDPAADFSLKDNVYSLRYDIDSLLPKIQELLTS